MQINKQTLTSLITRLEEEYGKATKGNWELKQRGLDYDMFSDNGEVVAIGNGDRMTGALYESEATFIADAHNSMPTLLSALRHYMAVAEEAKHFAEAIKENVSTYCASGCGCGDGWVGHDGGCKYVMPTQEEMQKWCLESVAAYEEAIDTPSLLNDKTSTCMDDDAKNNPKNPRWVVEREPIVGFDVTSDCATCGRRPLLKEKPSHLARVCPHGVLYR